MIDLKAIYVSRQKLLLLDSNLTLYVVEMKVTLQR